MDSSPLRSPFKYSRTKITLMGKGDNEGVKWSDLRGVYKRKLTGLSDGSNVRSEGKMISRIILGF